MATIIEVAKRAGVSPSTASRYIRKPDAVSEEKGKRIEEAITALGYTPNIGASFLKSNNSRIVGLVLPNNYNYMISTVVNKLAGKLQETNDILLVLYSSSFDEMKDHIRTLISLRCHSVLFIPEKRSHTITNLTMSNNVYPLQLFADVSPHFDSIIIDDFDGAYIAAKELLKKGNKQILLVDRNNEVFLKRKEGMRKAYKDLKIPFNEEKQIFVVNEKEDLTTSLMKHIYKYNNDAVIAVTEPFAQQVCLALQQMGKSIPGDISLIVYDDSPWAVLSNYSVISHPIDDLVNEIADMIMSHKENKDQKTIKNILHPLFLKRASIKDRN